MLTIHLRPIPNEPIGRGRFAVASAKASPTRPLPPHSRARLLLPLLPSKTVLKCLQVFLIFQFIRC
jgi:hypothetical protein